MPPRIKTVVNAEESTVDAARRRNNALIQDNNDLAKRNDELDRTNSRLLDTKDHYEEVLINEYMYHKLRCIELKRVLHNAGIKVED